MRIKTLQRRKEVDPGIRDRSTESRGVIMAFTAASDSSCKGIVSLLLGKSLAENFKVCVVDLNLANVTGELFHYVDSSKSEPLNLVAPGEHANSFKKVFLGRNGLNVDLVYSLKPWNAFAEVSSPFFDAMLSQLREDYDYVLVNTSSGLEPESARESAFRLADATLFVSNTTRRDINSTKAWIQEMSRKRLLDSKNTAVVYNNAYSNADVTGEMAIGAALGLPVVSVISGAGSALPAILKERKVEKLMDDPFFESCIKRLTQAVSTIEPKPIRRRLQVIQGGLT